MRLRRKPRRGVLLLVVLSTLVLFVLAGTTFLLVAGHYQRSARTASLIETTGDSPAKLLDTAMYELLRGTHNPSSSLGPHDLLNDLYGNDGMQGFVRHANLLAPARQIVELTIDTLSTVERTPEYYNGCVITMTSGPANGLSSRILRTTRLITGGTIPDNVLQVEPFLSDNSIPIVPRVNDRFVINGIPFNGTGFGYHPTSLFVHENAVTVTVNAHVGTGPVGLMPHFRYYHQPEPADVGGADEGFDAVTPQDMYLARVPAPTTNGQQITITPSFHRPQLIRHWTQKLLDGQTPPQGVIEMLGRVVMRPLSQGDNPDFIFTGSNPAMAAAAQSGDVNRIVQWLTTGPWDIDNDNDGVMDSVWLDLGLPNVATQDGRLYRPLFAILCTDLDGRLNLNAHGSIMHLVNAAKPISSVGMIAGADATITPPRGSGYGPAEVNLFSVLGTDYRSVLRQRYADVTISETRPGLRNVNDSLSMIKTANVPSDYSGTLVRTRANADPPLELQAVRFGSPPDLHGRGAVVVDHAGQPQFINMGLPDETVDDPYELNLVDNTSADTPFSVSDLESLLRWRDIDASGLSDRLIRAAPNAFSDTPLGLRNRRMVTTISSSVPVTNIQFQSLHSRSRGRFEGLPRTIRHMLEVRFIRGKVNFSQAEIARQARIMLPFEIRHGQRMDINRLFDNTAYQQLPENTIRSEFGHIQDSNGDTFGDADQSILLAVEAAMNRAAGAPPDVAAATGTGSSIRPDFRNDDESLVGQQGSIAATRQIYARHLFCLAKLLIEQNYTDRKLDRLLTSEQGIEITTRRIAQWAINVVDFRDPDSIMTPFEYDVNPMNGWQGTIDGDPRTLDAPPSGDNERRLVWGSENPHLVLTETLAFHDLRLKDTDSDGSGLKRDELLENGDPGSDGKSNGEGTEDEPEPFAEDNDLDQYRLPQGSFFAELYATFDANNAHPENGTVRRPPWELYTKDTDGRWKLDLGRFPEQNNQNNVRRSDGGLYPIWRLAISETPGLGQDSVLSQATQFPETTTFQPDRISTKRPINAANRVEIDRVVWFARVGPRNSNFQKERTFWNQTAMNALLEGKQYAVVGPRRMTSIGSTQTNDGGSAPSRRHFIEMVPTADRAFKLNYPGLPPTTKPALAISATMSDFSGNVDWTPADVERVFRPNPGVGVNVSEPLPSLPKYYDRPSGRVGEPLEDLYGTAKDEPADADPGPLTNRRLAHHGLFGEGTVEDYRTVFLQRLANPLLPWNPRPETLRPTELKFYDKNLPVNPYITVDWMPVDLTVFNGDEKRPADWKGDENKGGLSWIGFQADGSTVGGYKFITRERGSRIGQAQRPNILSWSIAELQDSAETLGEDHFFQHRLSHTLARLNSTFGLPRSSGNPHYNGDPARPFPWLTWNDRPYANVMELLLVPDSSPSRLLFEFSMDTGHNPYGRLNTFRPTPQDVKDLEAPYSHLPNFFHSLPAGNDLYTANLCRLFEFLEVPSRFVGTERWYNPVHSDKPAEAPVNPFDPSATFRPPFNKLSRFRDPGLININTIYDREVWAAIAHGFPEFNSDTFFQRLLESRRGFSLSDTEIPPSETANPFRSALGSDLYGELMKHPVTRQGKDAEPDVQATLLRSSPSNPRQPLFVRDSSQSYEDTSSNAYFRYQFLSRLSSTVTTHSNVFAVWITVGYFAVNPETGFLEQELNTDSGDVKRHRAFYIIDRSIPVAYQRGRNHNVDKAVLLRRFIE